MACRRRFLYTSGGVPLPEPIEVTPDYQAQAERSGSNLMVDRWLEGSRTTDGVDIGSRRKLNDYMKAAGVAHASDYTQHWERAEQTRQEYRAGRVAPSRDFVEQIGRTAYELSRRKK
jgi:hypothetical protein